jgi:hypothetical protein
MDRKAEHFEVELGWRHVERGFEWLPHGGHKPYRFATVEEARAAVRGKPGAVVSRVVRVQPDGSREPIDT